MRSLSEAELEAVTRAAVAADDFRLLMTRTQLKLDRAIDAMPPYRWAFLRCTRRFGKTRYLALRARKAALAREGATIRLAAPSKVHARDFVIPAFEWVDSLMASPRQIPQFDRQANTWRWPNGSRVILGSCETSRDVMVQAGTEADEALIDEAGIIDNALLELLIYKVLIPQFATTRGRGLIAGTPPETALHTYWTEWAKRDAQGYGHHYTIDDIDHVPEEAKVELIEELGGPQSLRTRRELYCDFIPDSDLHIVPEWLRVRDTCIRETPPTPYRDWYVAGDFGFNDLTVVLFGWLDFERQTLVIEHEISMQRASSMDVGLAVRELEATHGIVPRARVADAPLQMLADLSHPTMGPRIVFGPAVKDSMLKRADSASLAQLRSEIGRRRVEVNPRCKVLISHLNFGTWNEQLTSFRREKGYGHWDAIDALTYMSRIVPRNRNPAPILDPSVRRDTHHIPADLLKPRKRERIPLRGARQ